MGKKAAIAAGLGLGLLGLGLYGVAKKSEFPTAWYKKKYVIPAERVPGPLLGPGGPGVLFMDEQTLKMLDERNQRLIQEIVPYHQQKELLYIGEPKLTEEEMTALLPASRYPSQPRHKRGKKRRLSLGSRLPTLHQHRIKRFAYTVGQKANTTTTRAKQTKQTMPTIFESPEEYNNSLTESQLLAKLSEDLKMMGTEKFLSQYPEPYEGVD